MNKEKKIKLALTIAIGIIAIVGIIKAVDIYYEKNNTEQISISNFIENETEDEKDNTKIKVYITGEVKNQGVIELEEGDRIADQTTPNMIQRISGIFERNPLISKEI